MCYFFWKKKKNIDQLNIVKNNVLFQSFDECPICLESLVSEECVITNCNHFFHKHCLNKYIQFMQIQYSNKFRCPYCNKFQFYIN